MEALVVIVFSIVSLVIVGLIGCQMFERQNSSPTTPGRSSAGLTNYTQMSGGSIVVDGQQFNLALSDFTSLPFGIWLYLEVNQQDGPGKQPGDGQIPVTLENAALNFSGLPASVTEIVIGVKAVHDDQDQTYTERGRYAVVNGGVNIPLAYADLIASFGPTHYSIWFQIIGGVNANGISCGGQISLNGIIPNAAGQGVTLGEQICFGSVVPAPVPVPLTYTATCSDGGACPSVKHTEAECVAAGGVVTDVSPDGKLCKFTSATGGANCPTGWTATIYGRYATNAETQTVSPLNYYCGSPFAQRYVPSTWTNSLSINGPTAASGGNAGAACNCTDAGNVCNTVSGSSYEYTGSTGLTMTPGDTFLMEIGCI